MYIFELMGKRGIKCIAYMCCVAVVCSLLLSFVNLTMFFLFGLEILGSKNSYEGSNETNKKKNCSLLKRKKKSRPIM